MEGSIRPTRLSRICFRFLFRRGIFCFQHTFAARCFIRIIPISRIVIPVSFPAFFFVTLFGIRIVITKIDFTAGCAFEILIYFLFLLVQILIRIFVIEIFLVQIIVVRSILFLCIVFFLFVRFFPSNPRIQTFPFRLPLRVALPVPS